MIVSFFVRYWYNKNRYGVYVKETTNPPGWKCQSNGYPMLQFTTKKPSKHKADCSWPQNIIIHRYSENVAPIYSNNIKSKLKVKVKRNKTYRGQIPDLGQAQKCGRVKVLRRYQNPPPFKIWPPLKNTTQLNTHKNQFWKVWVPCYNGNKEIGYKLH